MFQKREKPALIWAHLGGLMFPKGETLEQKRERERRHEADVIAAVREAVWKRDRVCRATGKARADDEMHEINSRAKTRGLPPEVRFNTRNCVRLSRKVHHELTANRLTIVVDKPSLGADGPLRFVEKARKA
jgi:ADP-ribose pyrophosphatase YjhB (NUDIX family)